MPKKPKQLAKLSRPRLYDALPRERLFALLDEKRKRPVILIAGLPGARLREPALDDVQKAAQGWLQQVVGIAILEGPGSMASVAIGREQPLTEFSPRPPPEPEGRLIGREIGERLSRNNFCGE